MTRKRDLIALLLTLAVFLALRGKDLAGPFVLPFETAFQEAIALHHFENGLIKDRFLPVLATLDGKNFYHTAHPPLLHVVYTLLYRAFGVWEAVTRLFSLLLFLMSLLFLRELIGKDQRFGFSVFPLALFLPASFLLCSTTNYEPLSIFMVSLIAVLGLTHQAGARALVPALTIGMLVDWPVYLAVPALLVVEWKDPARRKLYLGLFAYEVIFFLALLGCQFRAAGEAAFFSHAPVRANPVTLFSGAAWRELFSHHFELYGKPAGALTLAAALVGVGRSLKSKFSSGPGRGSSIQTAIIFFFAFNGLLLLSALQLVSRHYVYLLYFTPLFALSLLDLVSRASSRALALAGLCALLLPIDFMAAKNRNPAYFAMATSPQVTEVKVAFSSSAVGAWKYYAGIETMFPMSRASALWLEDNAPDLLHLDLRHAEVGKFTDLISSRGGRHPLLFAVPGERVYLKREVAEREISPFDLIHLPVEGASEGADFREPVSMFIIPGPEPACLYRRFQDKQGKTREYIEQSDKCLYPVYSIRQHPGALGSLLIVPVGPRDLLLRIQPAVVHAFPFARSDGVTFMAVTEYDMNEKEKRPRLAYFRHLEARAEHSILDLEGAKRLYLVTLPGPRMNAAFDDGYWLTALIKRLKPDVK